MFKGLTISMLFLSSGFVFAIGNAFPEDPVSQLPKDHCNKLSKVYSDDLDNVDSIFRNYLSKLETYPWLNKSYLRVKEDVWTSNTLDNKQFLGGSRLLSIELKDNSICSRIYDTLSELDKLEIDYISKSLVFAKQAQEQYNNLLSERESSAAKKFAYSYFKDLDFNLEAETLHKIDSLRDEQEELNKTIKKSNIKNTN